MRRETVTRMPLIATLAGRVRLASSTLLIAFLVTVGYLSGGQSSVSNAAISGLPGAAASAFDSSETVPAALTSVVASNQSAIAVFNSINAARRKAGVPQLKWVTGLYRSALGHNFGMARTNQLSHQLAHEAAFGARISAQRVEWSSAGENIGWTSTQTQAGAVGVDDAMLAERAPNDGHRRNILSTSFTAVGVNVVLDKVHHRMWITEDFVRS